VNNVRLHLGEQVTNEPKRHSFEIFVKKNKKSGWTLLEATPDRQAALNTAKAIEKKNPQGSVRVSKETWVAEKGGFNSVAIHTSGPDPFDDGSSKKTEASIPCVTPDDLIGAAARDTIRRVLKPWFERKAVVPLELMHRADLVDDLEDADTTLQHAVQKVAIARSQNSEASVQQYMQLLNKLVESSISQIRKEAKSGRALPKADSFADQAATIFAEGAPEKRLRKAIAERLSEKRDFGAKLDVLIALLDDLPENAETRAQAVKIVDGFIAESLSFEGGKAALLGKTDNLGQAVERLTGIYEGKPKCADLEYAPGVARQLSSAMSKHDLPCSQDETACHILDALRAPKRFRPKSVLEEVELSRKLAMRLIVISGDRLHPESLVEAFTYRSARLLSPEAIGDVLKGSKDIVEDLNRLYQMEDNLVGESNKSKLSGYVRAQLKTHRAELYFVRGEGSPLARLSQLTALQARCDKSTFSAEDKSELAIEFDQLGLQILDETKILIRIAKSAQPPLDRAAGLLKLVAEGVLPRGRCSEDAKAHALRLFSSEEGQAAAGETQNMAQLQTIQALMATIASKDGPPAVDQVA
jgi:hypothetical protein